MNIDQLYILAKENPEAYENQLFDILSVRFRLFTHHRCWDEDDAGEMVQEALLTIARVYKDMTFEISFSAWAYKVLINR